MIHIYAYVCIEKNWERPNPFKFENHLLMYRNKNEKEQKKIK